MRRVTMLLWSLCLLAVTTSAWSISDKELHEQARFLADKMAYEYKLDKHQFQSIYEINYDFLRVAYPLVERIAEGDDKALTQYFIHLDNRNSDLLWVIPGKQFPAFMQKEAYFRPLFLQEGKPRLRVYDLYGNKYLEKRKIKGFGKYKGEHSRPMQEDNSSYYKGKHRIVAYGGQPRLLHDRNRNQLAKVIKKDFGK